MISLFFTVKLTIEVVVETVTFKLEVEDDWAEAPLIKNV